MGGKGVAAAGGGSRHRLDSGLMALSSIASGELAASQSLDGLLLRGSSLWSGQLESKSGALPALEDLLVDPLLLLGTASGAKADTGLPSFAMSKGALGAAGAGGMPKSTPPLGTAPHLSPTGNFLPLPLGLTPTSSSAAALAGAALHPIGGLACNAAAAVTTLPSVTPLIGSSQAVSQVKGMKFILCKPRV